jgi:PAS domain S-box-containing protein
MTEQLLGAGAAPAGVERLLHAADGAFPLGAAAAWPLPLQFAARFMLDAATPVFVGWGEDACMLYNDAAAGLFGKRHPALLGHSLAAGWPEAWAELGPAIRRALAGEAFQLEQPVTALRRSGEPGAWLNLAFAPLRGLDGAILGFSCIVNETTALRESEAKFRVITDAMPQMVWSTLPDGFHDFYNQRWYDFTGIERGETDGERWAGVFHPDDRARAWKLWRHALASGEQYEIEYRLRHHGGDYRWVLGRAMPVRDAEGRIVRWMGTCTDIDQQKRSEEILRDARLRQEAALVAADIGTWTYDLRHDRVYADRSLARIFGVDADQASGGGLDTYLSAIHPDDLAHTRAAIEAAIATLTGYECTYRTQDGAGGWRHLLARGKVALDEHGRPAWLPGIVLDVSRQHEAEQALRESEMRFRRLAESNVIGIIRYDTQGTILEANQAFLDMLGFSRAELERGELSSKLLTPPEWREANDAVMARLRAQGRMENYVKEYYRKDGSRASVQIGAATIEAGSEEGLAYVVDISPIRDAQQALRLADQRKDEFLAMLAHELRNPLAPITAAADFLKIGKPDEARIRQVTAIISRQASHMTGLIDDLLDVSRVTRGLITLERKPVPLAVLAAEAVEQVRPLVKAKEHHLELHMPPDAALVHGDRKRLVQVFANLLGNAAKYTPDGGRIDLHLRVEDEQVAVRIADDGIGMSPELVARAFELFSQGERSADRSQGGLGIGLALVKSLVELHGGTVAAASAGPGRGSRFTVTLPRFRQEPEPETDALPAAAPVAPDEALEVLIVDDNVDAAQILALYIEALGHRASVRHSPSKALDYALQRRPDLCVLDIGLPEFDGHELARRLRALPGMQHVPLVALSGYGQAQDRDRALAAGFERHFVKPVKAGDIVEVMEGIARARKIG